MHSRSPAFRKSAFAVAVAGLAGSVYIGGAQAHQPSGSEFLVNTGFTAGNQTLSSIAMDSDGDFVVSWQSVGQDGDGSTSIFAQRYNLAGVAQGSAFRVNTTTAGEQTDPSVAMDADGDFVVVWVSAGQDGDSAANTNVYRQRYSATGVAQGGEIRVNTTVSNSQLSPSVAMDSVGKFVVAWRSDGQDSDGSSGIYAQRYNAAGAAQDSEFRVNTCDPNAQINPALAMNAAGDFLVAWESTLGNTEDGSGSGIFAQRYDATGLPVSTEFLVNTTTSGNQLAPSAGMDAAGNFVLAWQSEGQDGSSSGVYAKRYSAAGVVLGSGEFLVNSYLIDSQRNPVVAVDADGDFLIAWASNLQDSDGSSGVYARRYNAGGVGQGSEFRVNSYSSSAQDFPSLAMDALGDFAVAWQSQGQDVPAAVPEYGIYARRYSIDNVGPSLTVTSSATTSATPNTVEHPSGTYTLSIQLCNNSAATVFTGLGSRTLALTNNNTLTNRTRDAMAAPGGAVVPTGGVGSEKDVPGAANYSDLSLSAGECVVVPYQIGLKNRNKFTFTIRMFGDNGAAIVP